MKLLYLDCFSGISGDMTVGALLDAGGDFTLLKKELKKLKIDEEYKLSTEQVNKNGITATKFNVKLVHEHHHHEDKDEVAKENNHHHHHHHDHRTYKQITEMISSSDLSEKVKDLSLRMFKVIGEAEGKIHGVPLDKVHFHEVGAVDSIVDIIGTAILVEQLKIDQIKSAHVPTGSGKITIDHGVYPVPAPATLEILRGIPVATSELKAELTTPTGAAIAAVLADEFCDFPKMKVEQIGYGAGTISFKKHPNVLRVVIGEIAE